MGDLVRNGVLKWPQVGVLPGGHRGGIPGLLRQLYRMQILYNSLLKPVYAISL